MLTIPTVAWATLLFALSLALTAGFVAIVRKLIDRIGQERQDAHQLLTKFRELHASGGLSDEEYRTIKTKLAPELKSAVALQPDEGFDSSEDETADHSSESA